MNRAWAWVGFPLLLLCCGRPNLNQSVFPKNARLSIVVSFKRTGAASNVPGALFALDEIGRPHLLARNGLVRFAAVAGDTSITLPLSGGEAVNAIAWMRDGALLMVSGRDLGFVGREGFCRILELPSTGMVLEPASETECYLLGGSTTAQRRHLYKYRKDGKLLHLLEASKPIGAVCGDGRVTYVAVGTGIYVLAPGRLLAHLYETPTPSRYLALAPQRGLFYATGGSVGYIDGPGTGFEFMPGRDIAIRSHGEDLYLLAPGQGILKCSPASEFAALANGLRARLTASPPQQPPSK
jgi:hypothetical protein